MKSVCETLRRFPLGFRRLKAAAFIILSAVLTFGEETRFFNPRNHPNSSSVKFTTVHCRGCFDSLCISRTCVYSPLYLVDGEFYAVLTRPQMSQVAKTWHDEHRVSVSDRPIRSEHFRADGDEGMFVPKLLSSDNRLLQRNFTQLGGIYFYLTRYYPSQLGHSVWNDIFSTFSALLQLGMQWEQFTPIIGDNAGNCCFRNQDLLERFSGKRVLWMEEITKDAVVFENFIVGRGQHAADDVSLYRRQIRGDFQVQHIMWLFRKRMYEMHDLQSATMRRSSMDKRANETPINVVIIANKRLDIDSHKIYRDMLKAENTFTGNITVTHVEWSGPNSHEDFSKLLRVLQSADIYVSGCGTGMMWFPLLDSGAVIVNLGDLIQFRERRILYYLHEMDHMMVNYVRVLYYPARERWLGVNSSEVIALTKKAVALIRSNFDIPVDRHANLHVAGLEFKRMCETDLRGSPCLRLLSLMGGHPKQDCAYAGRYPYHVIWGENSWEESGECAAAVPLDDGVRREIQNVLLRENLASI